MAASIPITDQLSNAESIRHQLEADATAEAGELFLRLVADYFAATAREEMPVSAPPSVPELIRRFAEPLPLQGKPLEAIAERLAREVIPDSNHLTHPMYLGHQVSAPLPAAVWTESLISALNNSVAVREMSPAATAIEHQVIHWMTDLLGFGPDAGGTLTSGGTEATFTALLAARAAVLPDSWQRGVGASPPVLVCGEHAHYAVSRAAGELGLGLDHVAAIPSRNYRMDTGALAARLGELRQSGTPVMAVVATAGSTATGSFDDLAAIGRLCDEYGLWLHVDAAHGASALLSARHRERVRGIERARSVAWDPHKMMLLPLSAGMVLVRSERDLEAAYAQRAPYLFHGGDEYVWDQGVRSFACSRRTDVIKLWVALQRYGADGIGALYDYLCDLAEALYHRIEAHSQFVALHAPESNILCFRWVGTRPQGDVELDRINLELRQRYNATGAGWITTTVLEGVRVLRVTIMNPRTTEAHLDRLLDGLSQVAAGLR
ncbi:MAG TPA: pyridoxal-dependent decarboxylase [Gemmatimonadales bacterium]|nr:pyridoxal-dependent decarboxylase [Gemmatimonadales bacterium]